MIKYIVIVIVIVSYFFYSNDKSKEKTFPNFISIEEVASINPPILNAEDVITCKDIKIQTGSLVFLGKKKEVLINSFFDNLPSNLNNKKNILKIKNYLAIKVDYQKSVENDSLPVSQLSYARDNLVNNSMSGKIDISPQEMINKLKEIQNRNIGFLQSQFILNLIKNKNYRELSDAISTGKVPINKFLYGNSILSTILRYNKKITSETALILVNSGILATEDDFIVMTKQGIGQDILSYFYQKSNINTHKIMIKNKHKYTLSTTAIETLNYSAFTFWEQLGSPVTHSDISPFHFINVPINQIEFAAAYQISMRLIDIGIVEVDSNSYNNLATWLPEDILRKLVITSDDIFFESSNLLLIEKFQKELISINKSIEDATLLTAQCRPNSKDSTLEVNKTKGYFEIKLVQEKIENQNEIDYLSGNNENIIIEVMQKEVINLSTLILGKEWDKITIETEKQHDGFESLEYLNLALRQLLILGSPTDKVIDLLELGASLPEDSVLLISARGDLTLIIKLLRYGLDLHYTDRLGRNAVSINLLNFSNIELIRYLIKNEVVLHTTIGYMDPLNYALDIINNDANNLIYPITLIESGAKIYTSHKQQLELLQIKNVSFFNELTSRYLNLI
jgi:hypothetical protein